jgi:hypothetical protein
MTISTLTARLFVLHNIGRRWFDFARVPSCRPAPMHRSALPSTTHLAPKSSNIHYCPKADKRGCGRIVR